MEYTIANKSKFLKIALIVTVLVFSIAFFGYKMMKGSIKSKATDSCQAGLTCTNDAMCGPGGHCALGIDGTPEIGRCLCAVADPIVVDDRNMLGPPDRNMCPQLGLPAVSVEGCHYKELTPDEKNLCMIPQLICDEGRVCGQDGICGFNQACIQPPMPKCPDGITCAQVMPPQICQTQNMIDVCPVYDVAPAPAGCYYEGNQPGQNSCPGAPKLVCTGVHACLVNMMIDPPVGCRYEGNMPGSNGCPGQPRLVCDEGRICEKDKICGDGQVCKGNCPPGAQCFWSVETCQVSQETVWWFDDNNKICQEKPFSPMPHMYLGLREFETKDECVRELNKKFDIVCPAYDEAFPVDGCTNQITKNVDIKGCQLPPVRICNEGRDCLNDNICGIGKSCVDISDCSFGGLKRPCRLQKICKSDTPPIRWCDVAGQIAPPPDNCQYEYSGETDIEGCPLPPKLKCSFACQKPTTSAPQGCRYQQWYTFQETNCPQYSLICEEARNCNQDDVCGEGKICFQEQNRCKDGEKCLDVTTPKTCRSIANLVWKIDRENRTCTQTISSLGGNSSNVDNKIFFSTKDECEKALENPICPAFSPPAPWCKIVGDGGIDANGCKMPPKIECPVVDIVDADGDKKACLTDYNWLQNAFNGKYDTENTDNKLKADFNKNGMIDENDMVLLKKQYDPTKCGQEF